METMNRPALVRTRYAETDQMGFIYHSHYFAYFEVGRGGLARESGMAYAGFEREGVMMPLTGCSAQFVRAAKYDDLLAISTRAASYSAIRIRFEYEVWRIADRAARLLATGHTDHLFTDLSGKPARLNRRPALWEMTQKIGAYDTFPDLVARGLVDAPS